MRLSVTRPVTLPSLMLTRIVAMVVVAVVVVGGMLLERRDAPSGVFIVIDHGAAAAPVID